MGINLSGHCIRSVRGWLRPPTSEMDEVPFKTTLPLKLLPQKQLGASFGKLVLLSWLIFLSTSVGIQDVGAGFQGGNPTLQLSAEIRADSPFEVSFPPQPARHVRVLISRSFRGEACIDELEVYGPDQAGNVAAASRGAVANASSCLPGYAIHQIAHLNDGRYGNSHSWIAATTGVEWAQISFPQVVNVHKVVISRDREGKYHDRLPVEFAVEVSVDGSVWQRVALVIATPRVPEPGQPVYVPAVRRPAQPTYEAWVEYAFLCERYTWGKISAEDHLSPLRSDRPAVPGGAPYWGRLCRLGPVERTVFLLEELLKRLEAKGVDVTTERGNLIQLQLRWKNEGHPRDPAAEERLYLEARWVKRQAMFRDPDLAPLRQILFVKRHPYHPSHNYSDILDSEFRPGGGVFILEIPHDGDRLEPRKARLRKVFDATGGIARDPAADCDAKTIYFAYRPSISRRPGWQPYWHLMAVDVDGKNLRQLTDGPFHDFYPCPLPDGDLAFVSTRIASRYLCWRPQVYVLFRMRPDGSEIRPLSFANLSEWSPSLLRDGRILWTRSEYLDKGADFGHTLWAIHPDGRLQELLFGNNTPNCYVNAHEMPGTRELCCTLMSHGGDHNGPIALIDRRKSPFDPSAITNITPDVTPQYNMNWIRWECFRDPYPVSWEYIVVSHAPADCFGLYVIDRYGNRELLYLDPEIGSMSPSVLAPRVRPPQLPTVVDTDLAQQEKALVTVVDVYEGISPPVPRGKVRYLRVCEEIRSPLEQLPDGQYRWDHEPFMDFYATPTHLVEGPHGWPSYVAKGVVGLVELSPEGSATFEVPAGRMLYFQVLDAEFNELQRMRSVVQFAPGEKRGCIGCHEDRRTAPPGKQAFTAGWPTKVVPPPWGAGPFSYTQVVQPILDRHCVGCHNADDPQGLNLSGTPDAGLVPASYRTLIAGGWVHYFDYRWNLRHHKAEPMSFGSLRSRLWEVLGKGHHDVVLSLEEVHAIKCWIDLNCPLWPDYQFRLHRQATMLTEIK